MSATNPDISIIVPVYNAEKYLERCINSILAQSFQNLELILIDDGSKDRSGAICDSFAALDARVVVKHSINQGVSAARNEGIHLARGKYVSFVDSDDRIDPESYRLLYDKAVIENADIVYSDYYEEYDGGVLVPYLSFEEGTTWHDTISNMISYGPNSGTQWNYLLIKKSLIDDNHLLFPANYHLGEDFWFAIRAHIFSKNTVKVSEPLYYYNMANQNSLTHQESLDSATLKWKCLCESYVFLEEQGMLEEFKKEISWRMLLDKTSWVMSPFTFKFYYSNLPEVNEYVKDNPLLKRKMKLLMTCLNKGHRFIAAILVSGYKILNRITTKKQA